MLVLQLKRFEFSARSRTKLGKVCYSSWFVTSGFLNLLEMPPPLLTRAVCADFLCCCQTPSAGHCFRVRQSSLQQPAVARCSESTSTRICSPIWRTGGGRAAVHYQFLLQGIDLGIFSCPYGESALTHLDQRPCMADRLCPAQLGMTYLWCKRD